MNWKDVTPEDVLREQAEWEQSQKEWDEMYAREMHHDGWPDWVVLYDRFAKEKEQ
jgi:hypothetical protein